MKWILSLMLVLSFSVYAKNGKGFAERKAKAVEHLSKRISILEAAKSCISSAADKGALKVCRNSQKASMKKMKGARQAWKAERKKRRAERKAKKNN